jgi:HSP20 family protein
MFFPMTSRLVRDRYNLIDRINDEFNRISGYLGDYTTEASPAMNVYTNDDSALVSAELPGVDGEKLDISVNGRTVSISGERKARVTKDGERCLMRERSDINFNRTFTLPFTIDSDKVNAEYKNGILNITLPKIEAEKPKSVKVKF